MDTEVKSTPTTLSQFFEKMKPLYHTMAIAISPTMATPRYYWVTTNKSIESIQKLLLSFQKKIKDLELEADLSCDTILIFRNDFVEKFVFWNNAYISSNSSVETGSEEHKQTSLKANNTEMLLKELQMEIETRFEQLIYEKIAAKKKSCSVEGSEYC